MPRHSGRAYQSLPVVLVSVLYYQKYTASSRKKQLSSRDVKVLSLVTALKFLIDKPDFNNTYFAGLLGLPLAVFNNLELDFLFALDFKLYISSAEFEILQHKQGLRLNPYHCTQPLSNVQPHQIHNSQQELFVPLHIQQDRTVHSQIQHISNSGKGRRGCQKVLNASL